MDVIAKFWGTCNDQKAALDKCFKAEKQTVQRKNLVIFMCCYRFLYRTLNVYVYSRRKKPELARQHLTPSRGLNLTGQVNGKVMTRSFVHSFG
jgi:hypothetical protein